MAQNNKFIYADNVKPGNPVYVISSHSPKEPLGFLKVELRNHANLHIDQLDSSTMLKQMLGHKGNWLLFVHGDAKTFEESVWRAMDIAYLYKVNVLLFSWPSKLKGLNGARNFLQSKRTVNRSGDCFNRVLEFVEEFRDINHNFDNDNTLNALFHSLGNLYLENTVKSAQLRNRKTLFDNLVINAAAVAQKGHKNWVEQLRIQKHLYITANRHDFNLKGAHIFTGAGKQLGERPRHPIAQNANYVLFNKSVGFRFPTPHTHTYFIGEIPDTKPFIKDFYNALFHGEQVNLKNNTRFISRKDKIGFEII